MNMDEAKEAFSVECSELLEEMESALLCLEASPDDDSQINAIFRAAHTIKGTSGLFGYDDVVKFTHVVETFLDKVRDKRVAITDDIVAVLLKCQDHMRLLVDHVVANDNASLSSENQQSGDELSQQLTMLGKGCAVDEKEKEDEVVLPVNLIEINEGEKVSSLCWHISIRFGSSVLVNGMDPISFLRYLSRLGKVVSIFSVTDAMPKTEEFNPENCCLGFEILLKGETSKKEIESVFEFVVDDCQLHIVPPQAVLAQYADLIRSMPESDLRIGEILVASGALTEKELERALTMQKEKSDIGSQSPKIGDVLLDNQDIDPVILDAAIEKQKSAKEKASVANRSIRVDAGKLGEQINLVGELVIAGARARLLARGTGDEALIESILVMERLVEQIRDSALRLRMVQIGESFKKFQRIVRDVSSELHKDIRLEISGEETELDKTLVEKIGDPLMHLVRNSMDHGLETPEQRIAEGKDKQGVVSLNAYHDSGSIVIEVKDDGRGLSKEKIVAKALEKGLITTADGLSESDIYQLIFAPGFSTAEQVTNLSGRGVGMDVVKKNIQAVRGTVDIDSIPGKGTTVSIRLPLTLAIIDGFLVDVAGTSYVIPLDTVVECIELTQQHDDAFVDHQFIKLRGSLLPYIRLRETLGGNRDRSRRENIVVVQCGDLRAGLVVDDLMGEFQTVIKPMGKVFEKLRGVSGATILGSGEVAMILDVTSIISRVKGITDSYIAPGLVA
ncbi:MAG: chemotaxis protein CheA [Gammaproteobacteria bacterium]|nr:chemotaxis protein CheA [Gammaproteobacteria bacterium]